MENETTSGDRFKGVFKTIYSFGVFCAKMGLMDNSGEAWAPAAAEHPAEAEHAGAAPQASGRQEDEQRTAEYFARLTDGLSETKKAFAKLREDMDETQRIVNAHLCQAHNPQAGLGKKAGADTRCLTNGNAATRSGAMAENVNRDQPDEAAPGPEPPYNSGEKQEGAHAFFDIAGKQLVRDAMGPGEKLQVLKTLFQRFPTRASHFLAGVIKSADKPTRTKLIELLGGIESPALPELYRAFLGSDDSMLMMQGVAGLNRLESAEAMAAIISVADHPDPGVRRLVANCIDWRGGHAGTDAIIRLANDSNAGVARIAIRKLGNSGNRFAFISLMSKLGSSDARIRKEAIEALRRMTGDDLGYRYSAPNEDRVKSIGKWQEYWRANQAKPRFLPTPAAGAYD